MASVPRIRFAAPFHATSSSARWRFGRRPGFGPRLRPRPRGAFVLASVLLARGFSAEPSRGTRRRRGATPVPSSGPRFVRASATSDASSSGHARGISDDQDDAPTRIDRPTGYSHGDEIDAFVIDEKERVAWWTSHGAVPEKKRFRWPPSLGHGAVPRLARAAWALVAVAGVARAASVVCASILFLPEIAASRSATAPFAAAVDAALRAALGALAEGALAGIVLAPAAAAGTAFLCEAVLARAVEALAPSLPRTAAPATARTEGERDARREAIAAARDRHRRFARLKRNLHDARRARHVAAAHAVGTWTRKLGAALIAGAACAAAAFAAPAPRFFSFSPTAALADAVAARPALASAAASGARAEFLALRLLPRALVTGSIVALVSLTRRRDGAVLRAVAKEAAALEAAYLRGLHRGTFSCRWRADAYEAPGERNKTSEDKALTNAAVAAAAMRSALDRGVPPSECPSLVLDAADARTSAALASARATRDPRGPQDARRSRGTAGDEEFDGEAVAYEDKWEGERVLVSAEFREGSLDVEFEPSARGEDAAARGGDEGGDEDAARDGDEGGRDEFLGGFPPEAIFVPNHHTHVVRSLRGGEAGVTGPIRSPRGRSCAAFAADVRDVLASRRPDAPGFHLVYLDHCGAVAQREQQIWDVFSRHAVCDGGVLAATFSTRGKRRGWSKAAAVATCARALVEAADAHGYELEGGAADGGGCASEPGADVRGKLMDYTVRFAGSGGGGTEVTEGSEVTEGGVRVPPVSARGGGETGSVAAAARCAAATAAGERAHAAAVAAALDAFLDATGGDGGEISEGSPEIADEGEMVPAGLDEASATPRRSLPRRRSLRVGESASASAPSASASASASGASAYGSAVRLAAALVAWAADAPPRRDGRASVSDTWSSRRRRRMCLYVAGRVLGSDAPEALARLGGASAAFSSPSSGFVSREDARLLASLGREVAAAARASAALTAPASVGQGGAEVGERTYERCFFLYGTLMFFVFRVRVKGSGG